VWRSHGGDGVTSTPVDRRDCGSTTNTDVLDPDLLVCASSVSAMALFSLDDDLDRLPLCPTMHCLLSS
jgi:hypothetical protein